MTGDVPLPSLASLQAPFTTRPQTWNQFLRETPRCWLQFPQNVLTDTLSPTWRSSRQHPHLPMSHQHPPPPPLVTQLAPIQGGGVPGEDGGSPSCSWGHVSTKETHVRACGVSEDRRWSKMGSLLSTGLLCGGQAPRQLRPQDPQEQHCPGRTRRVDPAGAAGLRLEGRQRGDVPSTVSAVRCQCYLACSSVSWVPLYYTVGHAASGHPSLVTRNYRSPGWDLGPETWGPCQGSGYLRSERVPRYKHRGPGTRTSLQD